MKKITTVLTVALFSMLSATAFACPKGTTLVGGTGPNHKGGTCVVASGTNKAAANTKNTAMKAKNDTTKVKDQATHTAKSTTDLASTTNVKHDATHTTKMRADKAHTMKDATPKVKTDTTKH
ncbi:hypothetical protein [Acinetobacter silvestris]|uniref:Lipoprotein n=1 Tax=Acinetobacter silvestris TaxID=1977882 RepID=A0A1Y3CH47_9GAMM|nr:hypothetical protein [Acinetobacter silvestris]OTG66435.1 hypothetical protein B9T28_04050 [Acinetobacter silvestris]